MVATLIPVGRCAVPEPRFIATLQPIRHVALLFGGPTLRDSYHEGLEDEFTDVVAVNGAAFAFRADWAVMVDRPLLERLWREREFWPTSALVTYGVYRHDARKRGITWREIPTLGKGVKSYTSPRALKFSLGLAGPLGSVTIFGMDWTNDGKDVTGNKSCNDPNRWKEEATCLRTVWNDHVVAVHGRISRERLDFIEGKRQDWPG